MHFAGHGEMEHKSNDSFRQFVELFRFENERRPDEFLDIAVSRMC
jgi:hypothetical protein